MRAKRGNERLKFLTTIGGNLGTALFAAAAARWFDAAADLYVVLWFIVAITLISVTWFSFLLLEPEE